MKMLISLPLLGLFCSGHMSASETATPATRVTAQTGKEFAQLISTLHPWSSTAAYKGSDWERIVEVAAAFQRALPTVAAEGFEIFSLQNTNNFQNDYLEDSKAFLLLRVMFDLPEHGKGRPGGPGWLTERRDLNTDGTVNLAWPVVWNKGQPFLASDFLGYEGFAYSAKADYLFLSSHYSKRDLSNFKSGKTKGVPRQRVTS
jgi:hypothetical protein